MRTVAGVLMLSQLLRLFELDWRHAAEIHDDFLTSLERRAAAKGDPLVLR